MSKNPEEHDQTELTEAQLERVAGGKRNPLLRAGKETVQFEPADE